MDEQKSPGPLGSRGPLDPAVRRAADETAREGTQRLVSRLWRDLQIRTGPRPERPVHVIDVGAGVGGNHAWLGQRLPFPSRWTFLDLDPALDGHPIPPHARRVHGGVDRLAELIDPGEATVLTCSAVLHLLTPREIDVVADLVVRQHIPGLFSLTRTGELTMAPAEADDATIAAASDACRRRGGQSGCAAAPHLTTRLRAAGTTVVEAGTPWRLTSAHTDLLTHQVQGLAARAVAHDPTLQERATAWLDRRLAQCRAGHLAAVIGHVDLLALPT